jgi:4-aminobutyrate aminotransferase-like enzyme
MVVVQTENGHSSCRYNNTNPLLLVSGQNQYLTDEAGVQYLDTRNNVCHVGHANPVVAEAVCRQVRVLNTNTRYLHPNHVLLAKRLLATFPGALATGKVFFVNSGSEANDLALRLARAHTGVRVSE